MRRPMKTIKPGKRGGASPQLKIQLMDENCLPYKKYMTDAGYDLRSTSKAELKYHEEFLFDTGIKVEIPSGYCGIVVPRSGKGIQGAVLKNTVGVIDSDYRGNILVRIKNVDEQPLIIEQYERFAQLIIVPVLLADLKIVDELEDTERDTGGFGSTDVPLP